MKEFFKLLICVLYIVCPVIAIANDRVMTPREIDELISLVMEGDDEFHITDDILKNKQEYISCISRNAKLATPKVSEDPAEFLGKAASKCYDIVDRGFEINGRGAKSSDLYTHEFTGCMKYGYSLCPDECVEYFRIPKEYINQQNLVYWCDCHSRAIEAFAYKFKAHIPINQSSNKPVLIFQSEINTWSQEDWLKIQGDGVKCFLNNMDNLIHDHY